MPLQWKTYTIQPSAYKVLFVCLDYPKDRRTATATEFTLHCKLLCCSLFIHLYVYAINSGWCTLHNERPKSVSPLTTTSLWGWTVVDVTADVCGLLHHTDVKQKEMTSERYKRYNCVMKSCLKICSSVKSVKPENTTRSLKRQNRTRLSINVILSKLLGWWMYIQAILWCWRLKHQARVSVTTRIPS